MRDNIVKEAVKIENDAVYSFKGHFNAASRWQFYHLAIGCIVAVTSVVAGSIVFSGKVPDWEFVAGCLALGSGILAAIQTFLEPQKKANDFQNAGADYKFLRDKACTLHDVKSKSVSNDAELLAELETLQEEAYKLSRSSPVIPKWAYKKAKRGIEAGEADYK